MLRRLLKSDALRDSTLLLVVAAIWVFFQIATEGTFLSQRNLVLLALQTSIVSLAAISAVMLIVTRNFDLSVGSAVALVGVVVAKLTVKHDVHPALAVAAAVAVGVAMGAWQGLWVTKMGVSSFIVTLAGMLYFRGISMIATDGSTIALPDSLADLATGFWRRRRRSRCSSSRSPRSRLPGDGRPAGALVSASSRGALAPSSSGPALALVATGHPVPRAFARRRPSSPRSSCRTPFGALRDRR
jgi:hypothetical protein